MAGSKRLLWADYTKAFAIWLMVLGHSNLQSEGLVQFIYIFHMPVFFLISGYFDKGTPFSWDVLKKSFKRIMVPYFFFSVCAFSICWISPYIHPEIYHYGTMPQTFLKAFVGMFLMEDQVKPYAFLPSGPLWFLVAMFWVKVFFSVLCLGWEKKRILIPIMLIIGGVMVYFHFPFFSLDSAVISLPFYFEGYLMKKYYVLGMLKNKVLVLMLAIICWVYTATIGMKNGYISVDGCVWGDSLIMFYINGVIGSMACILTFMLVNKEYKFIKQVGMSTLTILATHPYVGIPTKVLTILFLGSFTQYTGTWHAILWSIIPLAFGVIVDKWLTKYCPIVIGKQNENINNIHSCLQS